MAADQDQLQPIVCLIGPTASGKTELALHVAQLAPVEIISIDSAMVYQGMDIGTAKPSRDELARVPHHLINITDVTAPYSVGQFCADAKRAIADIQQRGAVPLLVGGTMMYLWGLLTGLADLPTADLSCRNEIANQAQQLGWPALHTQLQAVDPLAAARINPNDSQRIARALEVFRLTGKPLSAHQQTTTSYLLPTVFVLNPLRDILHQRIALRLEVMFRQGLIAEVEHFFARSDCSKYLPAMRTVGYRQVWQYLAGEFDLATLEQTALYATRQLAKRQITWLKRWPQGQLLDFAASSIKHNATRIAQSCLAILS